MVATGLQIPMILAIDPGAKPGYCLASTRPFRRIYLSRACPAPAGPYVVVCERPEIRDLRKGQKFKIDPRSILTLGLTAGEQMADAAHRGPCVERVWLTVSWKDLLYRGGSRIPKEVAIARLRRDLRLGNEYSDDEVDANGIALAYARKVGLE